MKREWPLRFGKKRASEVITSRHSLVIKSKEIKIKTGHFISLFIFLYKCIYIYMYIVVLASF